MPAPYEAALMSKLSYEFTENYQEQYAGAMQFMAGEKGDLERVFIKSAYFPKESPVYLTIQYLKEKGWKYLHAGKSESFIGYQAVVFINDTRKEIVIAHRGTVLDGDKGSDANVKADIKILRGAAGEVPSLVATALRFVSRTVRNQEKSFPDYIIHQTGHSLGGFFAECGAAYLENPSKDYPEKHADKTFNHMFRLKISRLHHANAITFDSLGSTNILQKIGINAQGHKIVHYLPEPNVANTANLHLGKRILLLTHNNILTKNHNETAQWDGSQPLVIHAKFEETLTSHPLDTIIVAFDPQSGQPFNGKEIVQWPTATNHFVMSEFPNHNVPATGDIWVALASIVARGMAHYKSTGIAKWTHTRIGKIELALVPVLAPVLAPAASSSSASSSVHALDTQSWIPGTGVASHSNTNNEVVVKKEKGKKQTH